MSNARSPYAVCSTTIGIGTLMRTPCCRCHYLHSSAGRLADSCNGRGIRSNSRNASSAGAASEAPRACSSGPLEAALPLGVPEREPPLRGLEVLRRLPLEHRELRPELEQPVLEPASLRADVLVALANRHRGTALLAGHVRRLGDRSKHH